MTKMPRAVFAFPLRQLAHGAGLIRLIDNNTGPDLGCAASVSRVGDFDGREMALLHRTFRADLLLVARVVCQVLDRDAQCVHRVAAHLRVISPTLHHHHCGEDQYFWPLLERRTPVQTAKRVAAGMEQQPRVHAVRAQVYDTR